MNQNSDTSLTGSTPDRPVDSRNTIIVRTATVDDAPTIADFNVAMALETENLALPADVTHAGVAAVFDRPERATYLCAEQHGEVIGCLMLTREWSDWRNGEFWWIQSVYVAPDSRKQGAYRQLYAKVRQLAVQDGNVCGIRLYVEKDNQRAQTTYASLGMDETHYLIFEQMTESFDS